MRRDISGQGARQQYSRSLLLASKTEYEDLVDRRLGLMLRAAYPLDDKNEAKNAYDMLASLRDCGVVRPLCERMKCKRRILEEVGLYKGSSS